MDRPALRLHEKPCAPLASTCLPQGHWCGSQRLMPRREPTATMTASLSTLNPHVVSGRAWSQSPLCCAAAAKSRALLTLLCRCCHEPSSVDVVCEVRHDDGLACHFPWSGGCLIVPELHRRNIGNNRASALYSVH